MSLLRIRLGIALSCAAVFLCTPGGASSDSIGFVASVHGAWIIDGKGTLSKGMAIPPGSSIQLDRSGTQQPANPSIDVVLMNGQHLPVTCERANVGCDRIVVPSSLVQENAATERLIAYLVEEFFPHQTKYVALITQGSGFGQAVLRLDGHRLDLTPMLRDVPAGAYNVSFTHASAQTGELVGKSTEAFHFKWNGENAQVTVSSSLTPGLYGVVGSIPADTSLVLVAPRRSYTGFSQSYGDVIRFVKTWPPSASASTRKGFERAAILHLAATLSQNGP